MVHCFGEHLRRPNISGAVASLKAIGIETCPAEVSSLIDGMLEFKRKSRSGWHSDASWIGWLKFALINRVQASNSKRQQEIVTAVLHVGFVSVEETDEQIERLRKDPAWFSPSVARSKIGTTQLSEIAPVDRVAKRVSN